MRGGSDEKFDVLVMGKFKNGKSTFINALVGKVQAYLTLRRNYINSEMKNIVKI